MKPVPDYTWLVKLSKKGYTVLQLIFYRRFTMQLRLRLGHTTVTFLADSFIPWDDRLSVFAAPSDGLASDFIYTVTLTDRIEGCHGTLLRQTRFFSVYADHGREIWYYTFPDGQIYASCREESDQHFTISYLRDFKEYLSGNATLFYLSALEYRMIVRGDLILHSSFILDQEKAILFAAPSGTGKSTQAHLWQDVRGSRIVNGDRALLSVVNGQWFACGWPMSGSSGISSPCKAPVAAVVVLSQSVHNHGSRLDVADSFSQLKQEIVLRPWCQQDIVRAGGQLQSFCSQVPVYAYACSKDSSAVDALYALLTDSF